MTTPLRPRAGFTLLEIVLAIGLAAAVMYLLSMAIELFAMRADAGRTRVESAQVARAILDQIAADLAAVRFGAPTALPGGGGNTGVSGAAGGGEQQGPGPNNTAGGQAPPGSTGSTAGGSTSAGSANAGSTSFGSTPAISSAVRRGLVGTSAWIRIDRGVLPTWQRAAMNLENSAETAPLEAPMTIQYGYLDGDALPSDQAAARGVGIESSTGAAGLYRQCVPTPVQAAQQASGEQSSAVDPTAAMPVAGDLNLELIAPEAVSLKFAYYNGVELLDTWDSAVTGRLPVGIEIRLQVADGSQASALSSNLDNKNPGSDERLRKNHRVEYRRFVRMQPVRPPQPAMPLMLNQGGMGGAGAAAGRNSGNEQSGGNSQSDGKAPNNSSANTNGNGQTSP